MNECIYKITNDECSLYKGGDVTRPSDCDKEGVCICAKTQIWGYCDMFAKDLPEAGEE